ncbi:NAD(P)H-dependent oxidoreductase subunit E [Micromonospora inyonensis]|uniref:Formate dehydrogenase gamma subunit n=1 Tax=Micromonospora inyonensis TaxID=47866 RepID=A0A1C6S6V2_9ACTN|nr:NAD(P)H-dependent oxidoreductase subunit E [Micromonospora inyonensis]SCL25005.1 formate dehydrogenase gamma subunit [Micromonospora inyonensis]
MTHGVVVGGSGYEERVRSVVAAHCGDPAALLPILHTLMAEFGHVDTAAIGVMAEGLNLSRAEIHGVISFYRDFRTTPAGRITVRICRGEACQSVGADQLVEHARTSIGVDVGQTTVDGSVTLDQVFCLGNCALGPSAQIGSTVHGRVDRDRLDGLVTSARRRPGGPSAAPADGLAAPAAGAPAADRSDRDGEEAR